MLNDTSDPSNNPEYAEISDNRWESLSESARQTIIKNLNDPASVRAYLRFRDTFEGYKRVREGLMEMMRSAYPNTNGTPAQLLPDFFQDLKESIDPLSRIIWENVDNRIEELKQKRRESLERLMQKAINRESVDEVRQDILNEIEQLEQ